MGKAKGRFFEYVNFTSFLNKERGFHRGVFYLFITIVLKILLTHDNIFYIFTVYLTGFIIVIQALVKSKNTMTSSN